MMRMLIALAAARGGLTVSDEEMDVRNKAYIDAVTREEWAAMAVLAEGTLPKKEMAALDAAESEYNRQAQEDEKEIGGYAEMLQMWKASRPGGWSMVSGTENRTCEEVGDVDIMEQVWRCAIPPFSEMEEEETVWGPTTVEAVDAVIATRLEGVRAQMYLGA